MLKLGGTLTNLAKTCLHKATDTKIYPIPEADKDLLKKILEVIAGGPSIVFTSKAIVEETCIRKSTNICKSAFRYDARQLYPNPNAKCQPMLTGLFTGWDLNPETSRFTTRQNKTFSFENRVISYLQRTRSH